MIKMWTGEKSRTVPQPQVRRTNLTIVTREYPARRVAGDPAAMHSIVLERVPTLNSVQGESHEEGTGQEGHEEESYEEESYEEESHEEESHQEESQEVSRNVIAFCCAFSATIGRPVASHGPAFVLGTHEDPPSIPSTERGESRVLPPFDGGS
jgi:hypothetical protein